MRRQGVGKLLLYGLMESVSSESVRSVWILPSEIFGEVESFFLANGFKDVERCERIYKLAAADFCKAASMKAAFSSNYRPNGNIVRVSEFTNEEMRELLNDKEIENYLNLTNFNAAKFTQPMCLSYRYNGHITACFICTACSPSEVTLRSALSRSDAPPATFHMLAAAGIYETIKLMGKDFCCFISPIFAPALKLTKVLSSGSFEIWQKGSIRNSVKFNLFKV